jgi:hypothetical protein
MSEQRSRFLSLIRVVWLIGLLCGALSGTVLFGQDQDYDDDATLVGTWRTSIVFPGVPFEFFSLQVFNEGGTMTDRFGGGPSGPGTSVGSGVWKKIPGRGNFAATFEGFDDSDSDGAFDRRFRIRATIHLLDRQRFTATNTIENLTLDGTTLLGPPFSGIAVQGKRMRVIRE